MSAFLLITDLNIFCMCAFCCFIAQRCCSTLCSYRCWLVGNVREDISYKVLHVFMTLFTLFVIVFAASLLFTQSTDVMSDNTLKMATFSTTVLNCHQFQLFGSVLLKCIQSSAVNTTVIPLISAYTGNF